MKLLKSIVVISIFFIVVFIPKAFAQGPQEWTTAAPNCTLTADGVPNLQCLEAVFANIVSVVISLAGVSLFVMLCIGAFRFLTSGGDPKAAEAAQKTMTNAFLGIVLIIAAGLILRLLSSFTGIDLLKFEIPFFEP